jgi:hypothetical protein
LALGKIAPFAVMAKLIANGYVGPTRLVQRGHDIRPDKTGATGHQQHCLPCPDFPAPALPQSRPAGNLGHRALKTAAVLPGDFTCLRSAVTDKIRSNARPKA